MHLPKSPLQAWPPLLATRGPGGHSAAHAHHGQHIVLATEGTLRIRVGKGPWKRAAGIVTAPDVAHELDADGRTILLVFIDPESDSGHALAAHMQVELLLINDAHRDALIDVDPMALMGPAGQVWLQQLLALAGVPSAEGPRVMHPRVKKLLRDRDVDDDASLDALAEQVGLSPGRLMHAFTASVGIPLRPYLAWLRLQRAAAGLVTGSTVSTAAHEAGFADAAHLTRTFKRMLGLSPSALFGRSTK